MENRKWLQRRYPKIFDEVDKFLNDEQLQTFKTFKYKLGRLTEDIYQEELYNKGDLCMFKRSSITSYNYPLHPVTVKCADNLTVSGYKSFWVTPNQVELIN